MDKISVEGGAVSRIDVDITIDTLLPGRGLHITSIAVLAADDVVRLTYEMTPPLDPTGGLVDDTDYLAWARRNDWLLAGRDDVGTVYDDWGGARGLSADGTTTDGERDLHPAPPAAATWLEIIFHAGGLATVTPRVDHPTYTLKLALPLAAGSLTR